MPTITFGLLYCFFVIAHDRRRILHFNVTKHPTSRWVVQQLREAFPFGSSPRFLLRDRDGKYGIVSERSGSGFQWPSRNVTETKRGYPWSAGHCW